MGIDSYQKSTLFYSISVILCATRSATALTVWIAYTLVICRIIMLLAVYKKKEKTAQICYLVSLPLTLMLFFSNFTHFEADIIHEITYTGDKIDFKLNYDVYGTY